MDIGHFYYLNDQYFIDFPDPRLMQNKETINGQVHDRPCFYTFQDANTGIYWMIPFSSRLNKFIGIYNQKMQKYGKCDTIVFGEQNKSNGVANGIKSPLRFFSLFYKMELYNHQLLIRY